MTQDKPIYEIKLVAVFDGPHIKIGHLTDIESGPALAAIRAGAWAEVSIPYHTDKAIYGFTVTIANKPAHEPAIQEIMILQSMAAQLYADYGDHAEPMVFGGTVEYPIPKPQAPDEEEAEAIQMMVRAFKEPTSVVIDVLAFDLFQLIGLIQFATRGLPAGHRLHSFARHIGDQMAEAVILATGEPKLREYLERGWNPVYDVVQKDEEEDGDLP